MTKWLEGSRCNVAQRYRGRHRPRPHCVRWWPSSPLKRHSPSPQFSAHICCGPVNSSHGQLVTRSSRHTVNSSLNTDRICIPEKIVQLCQQACRCHHTALKVICNDLLVAKVNCWSHALIQSNLFEYSGTPKDKKIAGKKASKTAHRWFVYFSQVMTSYQENTTKQPMKQPIECLVLTTDLAKTNRHIDKRRSRLLKHKRVK